MQNFKTLGHHLLLEIEFRRRNSRRRKKWVENVSIIFWGTFVLSTYITIRLFFDYSMKTWRGCQISQTDNFPQNIALYVSMFVLCMILRSTIIYKLFTTNITTLHSMVPGFYYTCFSVNNYVHIFLGSAQPASIYRNVSVLVQITKKS